MGVQLAEFRLPMEPWPGLQPYGRRVYLPAGGLSLFLYEAGAGDAPLAVLVHGLGDEADTWRHVFEPLAAQWHVVALDLPGFGRSDKPRRAYTVPFFCKIIQELIEVISSTNPAARADLMLVGHSTGAVIVHQLALSHRERGHPSQRALVLAGGTVWARGARLDSSLLLFLLPGLGERMYNRLRNDPQAAYESLRPYYANLDALPEADRHFLYRRVNQRVWSDTQRRAYFSTLRHLFSWQLRRQRGLEDDLRELQTPTCLIWGQEDRIVPVDSGRAVATLQPSARLVILPEAGHNAHQERPEAFLHALHECTVQTS